MTVSWSFCLSSLCITNLLAKGVWSPPVLCITLQSIWFADVDTLRLCFYFLFFIYYQRLFFYVLNEWLEMINEFRIGPLSTELWKFWWIFYFEHCWFLLVKGYLDPSKGKGVQDKKIYTYQVLGCKVLVLTINNIACFDNNNIKSMFNFLQHYLWKKNVSGNFDQN